MLQIKNTLGGGDAKVTIDGFKVKDELNLVSEFSVLSVSTLPYNFFLSSAVVFDNEIHILGSGSSASTSTAHYKFDGTSWTSVSTLPYKFYFGSAVVLNNEIHILGTYANSAYYKSHYKFDGSSWTSVSTLPYQFYQGSAVVLNNEIHILGGGNTDISYTSHYLLQKCYKEVA